MDKATQNITKMIITILITTAILFFIETNIKLCVDLRIALKSIMPFLSGRKEVISNICLGIWASSFIAFICFFTDYFYEKRKVMENIVMSYVYLRNTYLVKLGDESLQILDHYYSSGDKYKVNNLLFEYRPFLSFIIKNKHDRHLYLLSALSIMDSYFFRIAFLQNTQKLHSDTNKHAINGFKDINRDIAESELEILNFKSFASKEFSDKLINLSKPHDDFLKKLLKSYDDQIRNSEEGFLKAVNEEQELRKEMIEFREQLLRNMEIYEAMTGVITI